MSVIFQQPIKRQLFLATIILFVFFAQSIIVHAAQVTLAWDPSTPSPDGYRVYQRVEGQPYDYQSPVWPDQGDDPTQTSCTINDLDDGTSYYFIVRAYVGSDSSGDSNEVNYITEQSGPTVHSITTQAGAHGSISPASATVDDGASQPFSIAPGVGYHIDDVTVDGASVGAVTTYTFNQIHEDHLLGASFSINTYPMMSFAEGNGTISPSGSTSISHGDHLTYTITPATGYDVVDVRVDGQSQGVLETYTFSNIAAPHTIRAIFEARHYTLTATAGAHGTITPLGRTNVAYGGSRTFTVTPDSGYRIADVAVDGVSIGAVTAYTFTSVHADHTIAASFTADTHSIEASCSTGGSISPASATVNTGASQTFTIVADTGCHIQEVLVDGVSVGVVSSYTFSQIDDDHIIGVVFSLNSYVIEALTDGNGTISPSGSVSVSNGDNLTYTVTPANGYDVADVLVDGQSVGALETYTFSNITAPHLIRAIFVSRRYTLTATAGAHGTIAPIGQTSVAYGDSRTYTITPDSGCQIADVAVDGVSIGKATSYTFSAVEADHTIAASFTNPTYTIAATAGEGGSITPAGVIDAAAQSSYTFTVAVDEGYELKDLIVDGQALGPIDSYTFSQIDADHTIEAQFKPENQLPVADAGPDQTVAEQNPVTLSGLNSLDLDDGIATYEWHQVNGTTVELSSYTEEQVGFTAPDVDANGEALEFELTVTDFSGAMASDRCIVNVTWTNEPPIAKTGDDQSVDEAGTVHLSAAESTDPDDGIAGYQWRQIQGPEVLLSDTSSPTPYFTAPDVGHQGAALIFELTVTDRGGLRDTDSCRVTVTWNNMEPEADAGPDQVVKAGDEVVLDGSKSYDPDGLDLNYQWHQTFGQPVTLSDATAVRPIFTVPEDLFDGAKLTFELIVKDSEGLVGVDICQIQVKVGDTTEKDTTPPTVTINDPNRLWVLTFKSQIDIFGNADDDQQLSKVLWKNSRGGSGRATGTTQWEIKGLRLYRGLNTITITAVDTAGNTQSKQIFFYRLMWRFR